jgi:hypothetical protein
MGAADVIAPARRAGGRQRGVMHLVDARRDRPAGFHAVILAGLASGLPGIKLGRGLGEGRGLPLAAATQLVDDPFERGDAGLQVGDPLRGRRTAGTIRVEGEVGLHADSSTPPAAPGAVGALNNYKSFCNPWCQKSESSVYVTVGEALLILKED